MDLEGQSGGGVVMSCGRVTFNLQAARTGTHLDPLTHWPTGAKEREPIVTLPQLSGVTLGSIFSFPVIEWVLEVGREWVLEWVQRSLEVVRC